MMRYFIISVILLLLMPSCVEETILDPRERTVVVECVLENGPRQRLKLNYSSYLSENYYPPVTEVVAVIEEKRVTGTITQYEFKKSKDGEWIADFFPNPQAQYKLTIDIPNEGRITGTTTYPDTTLLRSLLDLDFPFFPDGESHRACKDEYTLQVTSLYAGISISDYSKPVYAWLPYFSINAKDETVYWIYAQDYDPKTGEWIQADLISSLELSLSKAVDQFNMLARCTQRI